MTKRLWVTLAAFWLGASSVWAGRPSAQDTLYEQIRHNINLFGDVYREITLKYVDTIDPNQFIQAGIDGMLSTLDPYTVFIAEDETDDLDVITQGKYGGVGLEIGVRGTDKVLTVISAMDDSPAQRVGIRNGDRVLAIDGKSTLGFSTNDAAHLLRGEPGTEVSLTIERTGSSEPIEFVITRRDIDIKDVPYSGFVKPGVGYLKLSHFSRRAPDELEAAIRELKEGGMTSLILDLRGNPGGLLSSAIGVLQRFCGKGEEVLAVRGRGAEAGQVFRMPADPVAGDIPLAVLVDGGSASAAEIVAGAVQDLDRGVIIGETTFGKGLVQSVIAFETGEALKLTTAKYYTPSGRLIQRVDYFHDQDSVIVLPASENRAGSFVTRNGRPVEGGGGIDPDLEVATPKPGPLGTELWRQGLFFDYATEYRATHPTLTSEKLDDGTMANFRAWLLARGFSYDVDGHQEVMALKKMLEDAGLADSSSADFDHLEQLLSKRRDQDFAAERDFIRRSIEQEIATSLWGPRGRIEATFDDDSQIQKAVEVLESRDEYGKVLAVDDSAAKKQ
ncbi:S41 family peptidase [candidate division KSB1 bacterium]|nr:S41 family peptidase [candidate division KSB1 bacterium]